MQQITLDMLRSVIPPVFEYTEACAGCQEPFITSDPDRKYCDTCLAERINGAGILEDDDEDFLDRPPPVRTPTRARVVCLVCGHEARIPILADAKICDGCLADLPAHKDRIEYELECAADRSFNADLDLHTAIDDASERDRQRYQNAVALREANDSRLPGAWATALAAGGSFAALLRADDAQRAAERALCQALAVGQVALEEIGKVRG